MDTSVVVTVTVPDSCTTEPEPFTPMAKAATVTLPPPNTCNSPDPVAPSPSASVLPTRSVAPSTRNTPTPLVPTTTLLANPPGTPSNARPPSINARSCARGTPALHPFVLPHALVPPRHDVTWGELGL